MKWVVVDRPKEFRGRRIIEVSQVQGSAKRRASGFVNFVPAVAYHSYLALPAAFTQPGAHLLAEPCTFFGCSHYKDRLKLVNQVW